MMQRDCEPCSSESNQYEDDWVCSLLDWLKAVTCVEWIRAYPDAATPDENETCVPLGQYGTVEIDSIRMYTPKHQDKSGATGNETCNRISSRVVVTATLTTYRYQQSGATGTRLRTCADVLMRATDAYLGIPRLRELLTSQRIAIDEHGQINNAVEWKKSHYERRSSQSIVLCVERYTSFADYRIHDYQLELDCGLSRC